METNSFGIRNFMQPMGRLKMHSWWALFSLWGWCGGSYFLSFLPCSQCVPNRFSLCSIEVPQVLKLFLKTFLTAPQFYLIWFAQSSTLMYINWKARLLGEYTWFYFATGGSKEVLPLWSCSRSEIECTKNWPANDYLLNLGRVWKSNKILELSVKQPCFTLSLGLLSPPIPSFSGIFKVKTF